MSFQLTLLSVLLLLVAYAIGQPLANSQKDDSKSIEDAENSQMLSKFEPSNDDIMFYDYLQQQEGSPTYKNMEKRWANQVRFGKRASWASSVRFG